MTTQALGPTVRLGPRIYKTNMTWSRRDKIFMGDRCIGIINLNSNNRVGQTTSLISQACTPGRQIEWCVEQAAPIERPRPKDYTQ